MRRPVEASPRSAPTAGRVLRHLGLWLAALAALLIAAAGPIAGPDVGFDFLCLWPIGLVTWGAGLPVGFALSLACASASCAVGLLAHGAGEGMQAHLAVHLWNFAVQLGVFGSQSTLLAVLKERVVRERRLARTDELTGIANRRAFDEAADRELERARRQLRPLTLVYLDVDDFKRLNDLHGHSAGDEVLAVVGLTLRRGTRRLDTPARVGGDEFALLLPDTSLRAAAALLGRLRAHLGAALAERGWPTGLSIGSVTFQSPPASTAEMVALADAAMYQAKRSGKGAIHFEEVGEASSPRPLAAPMPA